MFIEDSSFISYILCIRNDVHQISQERNQHIEAYQDVDRDNATLRQEMERYISTIDKLTKTKVRNQLFYKRRKYGVIVFIFKRFFQFCAETF